MAGAALAGVEGSRLITGLPSLPLSLSFLCLSSHFLYRLPRFLQEDAERSPPPSSAWNAAAAAVRSTEQRHAEHAAAEFFGQGRRRRRLRSEPRGRL